MVEANDRLRIVDGVYHFKVVDKEGRVLLRGTYYECEMFIKKSLKKEK